MVSIFTNVGKNSIIKSSQSIKSKGKNIGGRLE